MLSGEKILITGPAGRIAFGLARSLARRQRGVGNRPLQRPGDAREGRGARRDDAHARHRRRAVRRPPDRLHLSLAHRGRLQPGRLRPRAAGERRGHGVRARALSHGEGGVGDVDGHHVQAPPRPVARVPRGRSARRRDGAAVRRRTRSRRSRRRAVARYCARSFDLPVTIARMGAAYSEQSGPAGVAPGRDRGRRAGPDPLGSDALQPDPRRRHLRAARAVARRRERAGDDRELGR